MPWENEPDRKEWEAHGLPCLILRTPNSGALCGYVGVPEGHVLHGRAYSEPCDELIALRDKMLESPFPAKPSTTLMLEMLAGDLRPIPDAIFDVHGGLTYSAMGDGTLRPAGYWWFGFDCSHLGDYSPRSAEKHPEFYRDCIYRDMAYVTRETERLAEQLAALTSVAV